MTTTRTAQVTAMLNYAADRSDGGIWSNHTPEIITQALEPQATVLTDALTLAARPSLEREGFTLAALGAVDGDLGDQAWVEAVYLPACVALVRSLTGANHVAPFHKSALVRDTRNARAAPAAEFVHLDQSVESALPFVERAFGADLLGRRPRIQVYNVWKPLTPPPQDVPLALCDQRTLDRADFVEGRTVEPTVPDGIPYLSSIHNPAQRWYFFSRVGLDEAIIFKGYDSDPEEPFGCLHGAFRHPEPGAIPRASVEARIVALFDA